MPAAGLYGMTELLSRSVGGVPHRDTRACPVRRTLWLAQGAGTATGEFRFTGSTRVWPFTPLSGGMQPARGRCPHRRLSMLASVTLVIGGLLLTTSRLRGAYGERGGRPHAWVGAPHAALRHPDDIANHGGHRPAAFRFFFWPCRDPAAPFGCDLMGADHHRVHSFLGILVSVPNDATHSLWPAPCGHSLTRISPG